MTVLHMEVTIIAGNLIVLAGWLAGLLACLKWKVMLEVFFTWQGIMYYELISEDATGKVFAYGRQFA